MLCILIPADEIRVGLKEEVYIFEPDLREVCTVLSHFCRVQLFVTLWTIAHQAPLSMGFSWQEYWSGNNTVYRRAVDRSEFHPGGK